MDDIAVLERLVPAGAVIDLLAKEYDRRGDYANWDACKIMALRTLLTRLKSGYLDAWSTTSEIDSTVDTESLQSGEIISPWDFHRHSGFPAKVPVHFWMHFHHAGEQHRTFDTIASDFRFEYVDETFSCRDGVAFAVSFDPRGLPPCSVPSWHDAEREIPATVEAPRVIKTAKGRPPANWWADFALELALQVYEPGIPATQEQMIAAVFDTFAKQGKPEPSRTQVQPVVRKLFDRTGRAGK